MVGFAPSEGATGERAVRPYPLLVLAYIVPGVTYPVWHLVAPEGARDPWIVWWLIGATFLALGLPSLRFPWFRDRLPYLYSAGAFLVTMHLFVLAHVNDMEAFYAVGSTLAVFSTAMLMNSRRMLLDLRGVRHRARGRALRRRPAPAEDRVLGRHVPAARLLLPPLDRRDGAAAPLQREPRAEGRGAHAASSRTRTTGSSPRSRSARASRRSSASRTRWRRSAGWPAASRTTSTTCSRRSASTRSSCSRACPRAARSAPKPSRSSARRARRPRSRASS